MEKEMVNSTSRNSAEITNLNYLTRHRELSKSMEGLNLRGYLLRCYIKVGITEKVNFNNLNSLDRKEFGLKINKSQD